MERPNEVNEEFRGDPETLEAAFAAGQNAALLDHKRAGVPVATWRNGRVEIIPPEQIQVIDPQDPAHGTDAPST